MDKVRTNNSTKINTERKETYCISRNNMVLSDTRRLKKIEAEGKKLKREYYRKIEEILDH